jgi:type IV pilus assembly protein PilP
VTTTRVLSTLAVASLALACGDAKPTRPAAKPAAAAAGAAGAAESAAAPAPAPSALEWSYSSVGKRDPFRSFVTEGAAASTTLATRCATPLGRYELEQLKLVAVVTGLEDPVAMVEAPGGEGYAVRRGACVGKNGGTVSAVRSGEVVVAEWQVRADGTRDRTQTVIRLPRPPALNLEETP